MKDAVPTCPVARAALILGSRWTALILRDLHYLGARRFQDLQTSLEGVAPTTLSNRLKMLEKSGLVTREIYETHPLRAEYRLTKKGEKIGAVINAMRDWGAKYG